MSDRKNMLNKIEKGFHDLPWRWFDRRVDSHEHIITDDVIQV